MIEPAPLGVFDSGVGGLTVLRTLAYRYPAQPCMYVADQAHVPYGGRDLDEVKSFALAMISTLIEAGCGAIIMACNISSATAVQEARKRWPSVPIFGMIEGAATHAARIAESGIGVLATEGTVKSNSYPAALLRAGWESIVISQACPEFVPLIEAGQTQSEEAVAAARKHLAPMAQAGCDVIILGCTHYPFLLPVLRASADDLFADPPRFIDPAETLAPALEALAAGDGPPARHRLFTTGDVVRFASQVDQIAPGLGQKTMQARWNPDQTLSLEALLANTST